MILKSNQTQYIVGMVKSPWLLLIIIIIFFFCQCYPLKITFIVTEDFLFMMGRFFLGSLLKPRIPNIVFEHNLSGLTSDCKTSSLALLRQMSSALSASGDCDD